MAGGPRFLVVDGYNKEARVELQAGGASAAGDLYVGHAEEMLPGAVCDVIHPADPGVTPAQGCGAAAV